MLASFAPDSDLLKSGGLEYQTWSASFDCSNALADLEGLGVEPPRFDEYVDALVDFYVDHPEIDERGMN